MCGCASDFVDGIGLLLPLVFSLSLSGVTGELCNYRPVHDCPAVVAIRENIDCNCTVVPVNNSGCQDNVPRNFSSYWTLDGTNIGPVLSLTNVSESGETYVCHYLEPNPPQGVEGSIAGQRLNRSVIYVVTTSETGITSDPSQAGKTTSSGRHTTPDSGNGLLAGFEIINIMYGVSAAAVVLFIFLMACCCRRKKTPPSRRRKSSARKASTHSSRLGVAQESTQTGNSIAEVSTSVDNAEQSTSVHKADESSSAHSRSELSSAYESEVDLVHPKT